MKNFARLLLLLLPLLSAAVSSAQSSLQQVRFAHGTEYFPDNYQEALRTPVADEEIVNAHFVRYVQFHQLPTAEQRKTVEDKGVQFIGYVQQNTYLVAIPESFPLSGLSHLSPRSIVAPQARWKMHLNLHERPFGQWAVRGEQIEAHLQLYPHISIQKGVELAQKAGLTLVQQGSQNGFIAVLAPQDQLQAVAALPFVRWMELKPEPGQPEDINGRTLHRANLLDSDHPLGKKYNGEGVNVLVRDDGAVGPHIDFQGRLYNQDGSGAPLSGTHGDGVAGIIGGAGNLDPTKKGMAAGSDVYVVDYTPGFQDATLPLYLNQNVTITNTSYSNGCNAGYTLAAQTVDQQIFQNEGLMHVFSAGNSNNQDCGYGAGSQWGNITGGHKMAKNAIATANLRVNAALENSSSRGPADDGRLKPDIAAHGAEQNSTDPNNGYQVFGGTSAAAPGIAGCLAQLTHAYKTINDTNAAPAALLKLAILNTANEMGNIGPDFKFGWGHVNNFRALRLLEDKRYTSGAIEQGATNTHTVNIPFGTKQARIMIYWADPPADENAAKALLNDLDIVVKSPNGATTFLPWKLDPTPNAITLDAPAGTGRDSLNNVEQVAIVNPATGAYTVEVRGHEVPFGPQAYYLAWEFIDDRVKLIYPNGGESLVAGASEWIRWDAYDNTEQFFLRTSVDGGQTFTAAGAYAADTRMLQYTVPNVTTGKFRMMIIRGNRRDTSDFDISISPLPTNLSIAKICPDSAVLAWTKINNDTLAYDLFALGEKYMELKSTSPANVSQYNLPISDATQEQWFAIRASHPSGLAGRRTLAIPWEGGLKDCPQPEDLAFKGLLSIGQGSIITCGAATKEVTVLVANEGQNVASGATVSYQLNNDPEVVETLPDILPGETLTFTFATPLVLNQNGEVTLQLKIHLDGDDFTSNDSFASTFQVVANSTDAPFTAGFESNVLPAGWSIENPDGDRTWERTPAPVTGVDGNSTYAMTVNHFSYSDEGQLDHLYLIPLDLSNMTDPLLRFDYAHAQYNASFEDGLRVEAFPGCDLGATPVVLWEKFDPELATITTTSNWAPQEASQWRSEVIDLKPYAGQSMVLRFTAINGYSNNTFLDNVNIANVPQIAPVADFSVADTLCRLDTIAFAATPSPGPDHTYTWVFGGGATPSTANGPGPHSVVYTFAGNRTVQLLVANGFTTDTALQTVHIRAFPTSNFTQVADGLTVSFTNTSQNATEYLWNFGDNTTSTEKDPVHTYAAAGTYSVQLSSINPCRTINKTVNLTLTTGTIEQTGLSAAKILPNPNKGRFSLSMEHQGAEMEVQLRLVDASGRVVAERNGLRLPSGATVIPMEISEPVAGAYQLWIQTAKGSAALPVVVME